MQRTESKSWSGKNDIVPRTPRFSNHVVKGGMKTTGKGSPAAREPIVNKTRNTSEITEDNTVKTTGNGSNLIMPRIRNRSSKDFVTKNQEKRSKYRAFWGLRPRVGETRNEYSSQRYTLWSTDGQDLKL